MRGAITVYCAILPRMGRIVIRSLVGDAAVQVPREAYYYMRIQDDASRLMTCRTYSTNPSIVSY